MITFRVKAAEPKRKKMYDWNSRAPLVTIIGDNANSIYSKQLPVDESRWPLSLMLSSDLTAPKMRTKCEMEMNETVERNTYTYATAQQNVENSMQTLTATYADACTQTIVLKRLRRSSE